MVQGSYGQDGERETVTHSNQWVALSSNLKVANCVSVILDGQFRQAGHLDPMQYQVRTAVEIKLNDHLSIVPLGYVYTWNYMYAKQPAAFVNNEHRTCQQLAYK